MLDIFWSVVEMCAEVTFWFEQLLDATGLGGIYLGSVFVAMATGFLLKRFGSALSLGSDKAAQHFKRKGDE